MKLRLLPLILLLWSWPLVGQAAHQGLLQAAQYGDLGLAVRSLNAGAHVDGRAENGNTPLIIAAWEGHLKLVKLFIEHGANIEAKNKAGETALMRATNPTVVNYLLNNNYTPANSRASDKTGSTPLMHILNTSFYTEEDADSPQLLAKKQSKQPIIAVVDTLIRHKADIATRNKKGATALHIVTQHQGNDWVLRHLLSFQPDIGLTDREGNTPLHVAAHIANDLPMVQTLVDNDSLTTFNDFVNVLNHAGETALLFAAMNNNVPVCTFLVGHGARVNLQDNQGNTALMRTAAISAPAQKIEQAKVSTIRYLVNVGADITIRNDNGQNARTLATKAGNLQVVTYLLSIQP